MHLGLLKLGLTNTESIIYMAVLTLGPSPAAAIAKQANIKRSTVYSALERLIEQGLVSEIADSKEKIFKAEEPDRLSKLTRKMRRQTVDAEIELEKLLPGLKAMQKKMIEAPKVSYYQGMEGIKTILEEFISYPESWYYLGSSAELIKVMSLKLVNEFIEETKKFREKVGKPICYTITDEGYYNIKLFQKPDKARLVKILPDIAKTKSALVIYGKKLAVLGINELAFGAIIESAEVVELVKMMFEFIWQSLPEEKKKL